VRLSVNSTGRATLDTDASATQNFYLIYYFNDFQAISVCWHVAEIFFWYSCGGPIFVGAPVRPNMLNMPKSASAREMAEVVRRSHHKKQRLCDPFFRALFETHSAISLETNKA